MAESSNRTFGVALVLVTLVAVGIFFQADVEDQLAPEPVRAWVAIEVEGSGVAEVGPITLDQDTPFRLRAVVEAEGRGGRPVYYTEAKRLRIHGEDIPDDQVQTWQRSRPVKVRWFTVEGKRPFVKIEEGSGLEAFEIVELARSDWPLAWTIAGEIDAANDNHLAALSAIPRQLFGIQRFHVRVEIYTLEDDLLPREIIRSWGAEELPAEAERFPTVERVLPDTLAAPSRVFGLTQLHLPPQAGEALQSEVDAMARRKLVFTRPTVIRDLLAEVGRGFDTLVWEPLDLDGTAHWASADEATVGPKPGDLVRVGDRLVVLYEDRGEPGVFDYGDWCLDYVQGASVRALGDVFSGEGLTVEWATLAP